MLIYKNSTKKYRNSLTQLTNQELNPTHQYAFSHNNQDHITSFLISEVQHSN